ncbi:MAG: CvpA family protein [Desulfovibrionaceae bacterium]|nr:CvpA family protein [Desulfovibrionaceae bacterium]
MGSDLFDLVVILLLVGFSSLGFKNGFIREIGGIIAIIGGFCTANALHSTVSPYFSFIGNPTVRMLLAYLLIFVLFMLLVSLLLHILIKARDLCFAKWIDKLAGLVFGFIKGLLICALIMVVLQTIFANTQVIQNSRTLPYLQTMLTHMRSWMPQDLMQRLQVGA